jgi:hypothetical protein
MERELILVIICLVCYLIIYSVYTRRIQEQQLIRHRSVQIISGTGTPGPDATTVIPGPSGRDGILKESNPQTLDTLRVTLIQYWSRQRQLQRQVLLLSIFVACVLGGNAYVLWSDEHVFIAILAVLGAVIWGAFVWFYLNQQTEKNEFFKIPPVYASDTPEQKEYYNAILNGQDYYGVLGIPENASLRDIHKAYKELSKIYHSDKAVSSCAVVSSIAIQRIRRDASGQCFVTLQTPVKQLFPKSGEKIVISLIDIDKKGFIVTNTELNNTKGTPVVYTSDPNTFQFEPETKVLNKPFDERATNIKHQVVSRANCVTLFQDYLYVVQRAKVILEDPKKRTVYDEIRNRFTNIPDIVRPAV